MCFYGAFSLVSSFIFLSTDTLHHFWLLTIMAIFILLLFQIFSYVYINWLKNKEEKFVIRVIYNMYHDHQF